MSPERSKGHSREASDDSFSKYQSPHKKLSINKQLEFSGNRRNMSYGHQIHLKDRDGIDIFDEAQRLKQALIRNAQVHNDYSYPKIDRVQLPSSPRQE